MGPSGGPVSRPGVFGMATLDHERGGLPGIGRAALALGCPGCWPQPVAGGEGRIRSGEGGGGKR